MDIASLQLLNRQLKRAVFESQTLDRERYDNFYWHSRINVFNILEVRPYTNIKLFYEFYDMYTERYFTRQEILICVREANRIASYLCLLREPERELIILFNETFDYIMYGNTHHVKDEISDYLTDSLYNKYINTVGKDSPKPTAKMLDGIFSMTYYMLAVQPVKSAKIKLVLKMIERQLYSYINTLTDKHRFLREGYGVLYANQTLGQDTLLDAIRLYIAVNDGECNVPNLKDVWAEVNNDSSGIYYLDDVRILTSLGHDEEEQSWALSMLTRGLRKTFIQLMTEEWEEDDKRISAIADIVRWYSTENFRKHLPLNIKNYEDQVKCLAECLEPPREWGYRDNIGVEEYDDEDNVIYRDDDYEMMEKLEPDFYGLTDNTEDNEDKEMKEQMRREEILSKAKSFKITDGGNSDKRVSDDFIIKVHNFIEREYMNEEREAGVSVALYFFLMKIDFVTSQPNFPRLMRSWFDGFKGSQASISNFAYLLSVERNKWKAKPTQKDMFKKIRTMYDKLIDNWSD